MYVTGVSYSFSYFNPNWHEGDTFISLSFLDQIFSAEFNSKLFIKKFQTFLEVEIDINQVNLTPCAEFYKKNAPRWR